VSLIDSWRADSQSLSMALARNYTMCKNADAYVWPVALLAGDCLQAYEVGHSTAPPALLRREERDTLEAVL